MINLENIHKHLASIREIEERDGAIAVAKMAVKVALGEDNDYLQRLLVSKLENTKKKYSNTNIIELLNPFKHNEIAKKLKSDVDATQKKALDVLCEKTNDLLLKSYAELINSTITLKSLKLHDARPTETSLPTTTSVASHPPTHVIIDVGEAIEQSENYPTTPDEHGYDTKQTIDLSGNRAVSSWVINTLLYEKLNYRYVQLRAERWKYINGILAAVLPIIATVVAGVVGYYLPNPNQNNIIVDIGSSCMCSCQSNSSYV